MKKRNMLKDADDSVTFMRLSESEIADDVRSEMMYFDGIPEYHDGEAPPAEELLTVEKVLKYASQCNFYRCRRSSGDELHYQRSQVVVESQK